MMNKCRIDIVDDEESIRDSLNLALSGDYAIRTFASGEDALSALENEAPDLAIVDIGLPGMSGVKVLERIKAIAPAVLVIVVTAHEDVATVVASMKSGAYDYIVKPIQMEALERCIDNALSAIRLRSEVHALQERHVREDIPCFVGESEAVQDMMDFIAKVAGSPDTPILIVGETGTGKELIARAVHFRSPNFKGPLVTVNCAAIPRELIESELFGYSRGAFSGANASGKKGLIEEAGGGTLFLDEVGDLSLEAQAKLLRFLEQGEFYKVGGTKKLHVKTRVVSATNQDLEKMAASGDYRKDLYFRLGVITVRVPSLNQRREDILPLARHFLAEFGRKFGRRFEGISPCAVAALDAHRWTGNVRELRNMMERAALVGECPQITARDLGLDGSPGLLPVADRHPIIPPTGVDFQSLQEAFERRYIAEALHMAGGNECKAAELLRINHHKFRYHRKKLSICKSPDPE